jgi:hypothetical protein
MKKTLHVGTARERLPRMAVMAVAALLLTGHAAVVAQDSATASEERGESTACPSVESFADGFDRPLAVVRYLADDALEGRQAGSAGASCAADFVALEFERLGLTPAGSEGTFFQSVPLASVTNPHASGGTGRNVIALLEGADPSLSDEFLIVGAHFDHLGTGAFGSMEAESGEIHNGADDNASGVASMLAVAAHLAQAPPPARPVLFIAFTGEELGLLGSGHFAKNPTRPLDQVRAMLNLDMVGRLGDDPLIVYGMGTAEEWEEVVAAANAEVALQLAYESAGYGPSDHTSFYARDIPVLHFFTNVHADYHKPSDDWDKIDARGIERVAELVSLIAADVAGRPAQLALVRGAGAPQQRAEGYGAWLGTIPDFTPVEHGVLISGVGSESPAEKAGLEGGDIVIWVGEFEVADLYGLTDALRAYKPGDQVEVRVLRDGEQRTFQVVLGNRAERSR